MAIPVKLQVFEGPLDLLMHLIEKNKIDIYDIPIAEITDQYLEYVRQMDHEDMDITSEFLVMAATLLDIKSRMLLPREKDEETGEEEGDPREELVQRLLEYKMYKYLSEELAVRREQAGVRYFRAQNLPKEVRSYQPPIDYEDLLKDTDLKSLKKVFGEVLRRKKSRRDPIRSGFGKIKREEVSIDSKTLYIRAYLQAHPHTDFRALLEQEESKEEVIVTFLILLELMKTQKVQIVQDSIGGKIFVEAAEMTVMEKTGMEAPVMESSNEGTVSADDTGTPTEGAVPAEEMAVPKKGTVPADDAEIPEEEPVPADVTEIPEEGPVPADVTEIPEEIPASSTGLNDAKRRGKAVSSASSARPASNIALTARRHVEVVAPLTETPVSGPVPSFSPASPIPAIPAEFFSGKQLFQKISSEHRSAEDLFSGNICIENPLPEDISVEEMPCSDQETPVETEAPDPVFPEVKTSVTEAPEIRTASAAQTGSPFSAVLPHLWQGITPDYETHGTFEGSSDPCTWPGALRPLSCRPLWERNRLSRMWARRKKR